MGMKVSTSAGNETGLREEARPAGNLLNIPNALSMLRLVLQLPLWVLALSGQRVALAVLLLFAAATDVVDGFLARRRGATRVGSQIDSVADLMLMGSSLTWLFLLRWDFVERYAVLLVTWAAIGLLSLLIGWIRFRRIGNLHLYSAKAVSVMVYPFVAGLLAGLEYPDLVAWIAIGLCIVASVESLAVMATRRSVDEHVGSIFKSS
jgi:phosphatidylglycerophosphate synthase